MNSQEDFSWLPGFLDEVYLIPEDHSSEGRTEPVPAPEVQDKPVFSGSNKKNILVLVPSEPAPEERTLLENILGAANLVPDDIALVNWGEYQRPDLPHLLKSHVVISFGLEKDPWCEAGLYEITAAGGLTHLRAHALTDLQADKQRKRLLWNALRELFGI